MNVIMTGGGTGGHLYPALAIAEKIKERDPEANILFLGTADGIEAEIVPKHGYEFRAVPARWFYRGEGFFYTVKEFFKALHGTLRGISASKKIMKEFKPDAAIGTGGFVSVPVIIAAKRSRAKCYIHEQNAYPGMGNRILSRFCDKVFLGFDGVGESFKHPERTVYTGNPVRQEFLDITKEKARENLGISERSFVVFTFGGSLGSKMLNDTGKAFASRNAKEQDVVTIIGTGERFHEDVKSELAEAGLEESEQLRVLPYISDMPSYIAASDLIVCRAGALSLAEVTVCGVPSILIPYPWAAGDHQYFNAKNVADLGGAVLFRQDDVTPEEVAIQIEGLRENPEKLKEMSVAARKAGVPNSTEVIFRELVKDYGNR